MVGASNKLCHFVNYIVLCFFKGTKDLFFIRLGVIHMEIKEGYVYHIKNDYFELVNDDKLMKKHE